MRAPLLVILLLALKVTSPAQNATTALSALRLVPKAESSRLARIEAREGSPTPERWHILVHDPKEETGLREYVISGGDIIASRALSQFVEALKPEDVIEEPVKIDSDRVGRIAQEYARANKLPSTSLSYQLKKDGDSAHWTVGCFADGKRAGEVVIHADKGTVLSHSGFAVQPPPERQDAIASNDPDRDSDAPRERESTRDRERARARRQPRPTPVRTIARAQPAPRVQTPPPERANPIRRIGDSFGRIFGR